MARPTIEFATAQLTAWQVALAELALVEATLSSAMSDYAKTLAEPPRNLIIECESRRKQVDKLFEVAIAALDACSPTPTGLSDFGGVN